MTVLHLWKPFQMMSQRLRTMLKSSILLHLMTELIPCHHYSLSAHLLLNCWNVSGTSSWRAALSGHSAAGGLMTELHPHPSSTHTSYNKNKSEDSPHIYLPCCDATPTHTHTPRAGDGKCSADGLCGSSWSKVSFLFS